MLPLISPVGGGGGEGAGVPGGLFDYKQMASGGGGEEGRRTRPRRAARPRALKKNPNRPICQSDTR